MLLLASIVLTAHSLVQDIAILLAAIAVVIVNTKLID
jgi:hypothetical protein